jgi:hypothetical protein
VIFYLIYLVSIPYRYSKIAESYPKNVEVNFGFNSL